MSTETDLPLDLLEQRIKAACWLNGIGMRQLRGRLGEIGAAKLLAEDMIKGEKPQDRRNRRDLCEALRVPAHWFTEADWRKLIAPAEAPGAEPPALHPRDLRHLGESEDEAESA